jgi:hypothetical protein
MLSRRHQDAGVASVLRIRLKVHLLVTPRVALVDVATGLGVGHVHQAPKAMAPAAVVEPVAVEAAVLVAGDVCGREELAALGAGPLLAGRGLAGRGLLGLALLGLGYGLGAASLHLLKGTAKMALYIDAK